jgi:hypothetical protein
MFGVSAMKIGMIFRVLASAVLMLLAVSTGAKAVTYTLTNVGLDDGGVLNGWFKFNVYGGFVGYYLETTGGAASLDSTYTYPTNPASTANPFGNPTVLQFFPDGASPVYKAVLQLTFDSDLLVAGAHTLLGGSPGPSFECNDSYICPLGWSGTYPIRYVAANTAVYGVLPVPGALLFLATGAGLLGLMAVRKRSRKVNLPALAAA